MCGSLRLHQRAQEHQQIGDPDDGQPQIGIPFRLGIFLRLGDAEQIAGAGDHDEEVVAEHHEPGRELAGEAGPAGPLHHVERGRDQHVAAEGEDHRRGVQRPDAAEIEPGQIEVERRTGEFERRPQADQESGDAPEHRERGRDLHRAEIVVRPAVDLLRRQLRRPIEVVVEDAEHDRDARRGGEIGVEGKGGVFGLGGTDQGQQRQYGEDHHQPGLALGHRLARSGLSHCSIPSVRFDHRSFRIVVPANSSAPWPPRPLRQVK